MQQNNQIYLMWQELDERIPLTDVAADACAAYIRRFPDEPAPNTILISPGVALVIEGMTVQPSLLVGRGVLYVGYVPPALIQAPPAKEPEETPAEKYDPPLSDVGQTAPAGVLTTTSKGFAAFCRPVISRRAS